MLSYLTALAKSCFSGNIELFAFFNRALEKGRLHKAFICFHVKVVQSIEDHHQEVPSVCKENGLHGLVAYDSN
ncbi:Constitutive coactivator of PPAR-gamma-like protein 1 [Manis javanica]|nr:Constitutive coactivator of PPAR-gamma-like protein 1 [Manis javanica]